MRMIAQLLEITIRLFSVPEIVSLQLKRLGTWLNIFYRGLSGKRQACCFNEVNNTYLLVEEPEKLINMS